MQNSLFSFVSDGEQATIVLLALLVAATAISLFEFFVLVRRKRQLDEVVTPVSGSQNISRIILCGMQFLIVAFLLWIGWMLSKGGMLVFQSNLIVIFRDAIRFAGAVVLVLYILSRQFGNSILKAINLLLLLVGLLVWAKALYSLN